MSVKAMGKIWELHLPHHDMLLLLALADHADHDGAHIYPSIDFIAWKTGYSARQVQRIIANLVEQGLLMVMTHGGGRGRATEYAIDFEKGVKKSPFNINHDKMSPFDDGNPDKMSPYNDKPRQNVTVLEEETVPSTPVKGDILSVKGDIAMSPQPSRTIRELQEQEEEKTPPPPSVGEETPEEGIATPEEFIALYNANVPKGIPQAKTLSPDRRQRIAKVLKAFSARMFWITCFRAPASSAFLRGEKPRPGHERFTFDVEFLLRKGKDGVENCVKVYEGKYDDEQQTSSDPSHDKASLDDLSPRMQNLVRQAQHSATRMKNDPRWNPALRKDPHAQP